LAAVGPCVEVGVRTRLAAHTAPNATPDRILSDQLPSHQAPNQPINQPTNQSNNKHANKPLHPPQELSDGDADLVVVHEALGFGHCHLALGVPSVGRWGGRTGAGWRGGWGMGGLGSNAGWGMVVGNMVGSRARQEGGW
jgi:hypothetical protein